MFQTTNQIVILCVFFLGELDKPKGSLDQPQLLFITSLQTGIVPSPSHIKYLQAGTPNEQIQYYTTVLFREGIQY